MLLVSELFPINMINKFRFRKKSLDDNLLSRKDEIRTDGNGTGTLTKDEKKVSY